MNPPFPEQEKKTVEELKQEFSVVSPLGIDQMGFRNVFVNMKIGKNEVTPWKDFPVGYIKYPVCATIDFSPKNSVRFVEFSAVEETYKQGRSDMLKDVCDWLSETYPKDNDGPYRCGDWFSEELKKKFGGE